MIIGLTGGIASGKSTVANYITSLGIPLCDTDVLAREVVSKNTIGLQKLVQAFGESILTKDQTLNREKLANRLFKNPNDLKRVNEILHPLILERVEEFKKNHPNQLIVIDMPLLFEIQYDKVDKIMLVYVDDNIQKERLMRRNGYTLEQANERINSQMPLIQKIEKSDYVINNNGSREDTLKQVRNVLDCLKDKGENYAMPPL